ncbi:MAG: transposase [Verrucomicrobia bacterium]|nr:transposase [Verrucomicrobiota bacterium]
MNTPLPDSVPPGAQSNNADRSVRVTRPIPFRGYNQYTPVDRTRRNVPHWTQPGATYFITFRLGDSVPIALQQQWAQEREIWLRFHPEPSTAQVEAEYRERFTERMEEWMDRGFGECHLRRPDVRAAVEKHMLHFDGQRYDVDAFVVMPNHVHVLMRPHDGHDLFEVLQGIKGTSARTCNKLLGRTGTTFWMEDSYNRIVRDAEELFGFRRYIAANPAKAKLAAHEFTLLTNNVLYVEP